jgi:hypothetical protein
VINAGRVEGACCWMFNRRQLQPVSLPPWDSPQYANGSRRGMLSSLASVAERDL